MRLVGIGGIPFGGGKGGGGTSSASPSPSSFFPENPPTTSHASEASRAEARLTVREAVVDRSGWCPMGGVLYTMWSSRMVQVSECILHAPMGQLGIPLWAASPPDPPRGSA